MLRNQRGMIVKHVDGSLDDFIDKVLVWGIPYYRDKAQDIDQKGDQDKKGAAKEKQLKDLSFWIVG